jgi:hypothetical protein
MDIQKKPYNELKYLVANEQLDSVLQIMKALYGASDPFESGIVDTLYYDTNDGKYFKQCLRGDFSKNKYRIRGYGGDSFHQLHKKTKSLDMVSKKKFKIIPLLWKNGVAPEWSEILVSDPSPACRNAVDLNGEYLLPVVRVTYFRYRFRINDYRLTLDTRIEITAPANGWITNKGYGVLQNHVLEIKTAENRPFLPLLGLVRLAPSGFSKFKQGLELLQPNI